MNTSGEQTSQDVAQNLPIHELSLPQGDDPIEKEEIVPKPEEAAQKNKSILEETKTKTYCPGINSA